MNLILSFDKGLSVSNNPWSSFFVVVLLYNNSLIKKEKENEQYSNTFYSINQTAKYVKVYYRVILDI